MKYIGCCKKKKKVNNPINALQTLFSMFYEVGEKPVPVPIVPASFWGKLTKALIFKFYFILTVLLGSSINFCVFFFGLMKLFRFEYFSILPTFHFVRHLGKYRYCKVM